MSTNKSKTRGYVTGVKEGFADAVELSNMGLAALEGATIRMRKRVASKLAAKGLAYFSGYVRGHELFSLYLPGKDGK